MAMGEVGNVIKGSKPKRKRNRADEMERENRCRRGVAAVLSVLGYKPQDQDDDLTSVLDFLETLGNRSKKMIKKKPNNRTREKLLSKDKKMIICWKENKGKAVSIMLKEKRGFFGNCDHGWQNRFMSAMDSFS